MTFSRYDTILSSQGAPGAYIIDQNRERCLPLSRIESHTIILTMALRSSKEIPGYSELVSNEKGLQADAHSPIELSL